MSGLEAIIAAHGVALLDAGLATSLEDRGHDLDDPLWSARVLLDAPESIAAVHAEHLAAGADIVTTATYQATISGLAARGLTPAATREVFRRAIAIARDAVDAASRDAAIRPLVAASIGSYGAFLADGSEYRGDYEIDDRELAGFHRERLAIVSVGADIIACETIPCVREAIVLADLLAEHDGPPAWVSFSARDDAHTAHGERIEDAAAALAGSPRIVALGINCVAPTQAEPLLRRLRDATDRRLVAYPSSGERWSAGWCGSATSAQDFGALAQRWYDAGARIIGGCCRTGAAHIAALARWRSSLRDHVRVG